MIIRKPAASTRWKPGRMFPDEDDLGSDGTDSRRAGAGSLKLYVDGKLAATSASYDVFRSQPSSNTRSLSTGPGRKAISPARWMMSASDGGELSATQVADLRRGAAA